MAPKSIKLIYFDSRGRAEVCRLVLAAAGREYEDVRLTREEWAVEKPNTPFGQAPVIEIDGKRYAQSVAIATYLAREFGFHGKSNLEGLEVDQVVQLGKDFEKAGSNYFHEQDEIKKPELLKNLKDIEIPTYLGLLEGLLKETGTGYFVGKSLTLADIFILNLIHNVTTHLALATTEGYPLLQANNKLVENNERIKAYLAARKPTER